MAPHSSTLGCKSHGRRSLVGCSPWGREESDTTEQLDLHFSLSCIGEGNGNALQWSCLENPRDGEPDRLPSLESHRVRHDWSDLAAFHTWCPEVTSFCVILGSSHLSSQVLFPFYRWSYWVPEGSGNLPRVLLLKIDMDFSYGGWSLPRTVFTCWFSHSGHPG